MSRIASLLLAASAFALSANAETIAITHAKIETASAAGTIEDGTLVIKDGKIAAVGAHVAVPSGARVIDAKGGVVTPGLFAASTDLTAVEVGGVRSTHEESAKLGAAFDVQYGINPASTLVPLARQTGLTRVMVTPVSPRGFGGDQDENVGEEFTAGTDSEGVAASSLFGGRAAGVVLKAGDTDPVFAPKAAVAVDLGDAGARVAGSHGAALQLLKTALEDARSYGKRRAAYENGQTRAYSLSHEELEALQPVLAGKAPLLARVHSAGDIRQLLKLAKEQHIKLVLEGAEEAWLVADALAATKTPVIIDTEQDLPQQFESLGARLDNAARLEKAGVLFAISGSRSFNELRQARFNAGTAVANGLSYAAAIKAVTVNPARIWGLEAKLGTLAPGKEADVVLWNGDPLETTTWPVTVIIAGVEQPQGSRGFELRDRYLHVNDGMPSAYH
ncbi:imidazolonepropionase-like amidohydrolase [Rhizomicrobium palustre]|uniref:Imidazolonepropionase-like amidohydrolase n=1 Tax=Rhizomicrobium palustre TaxID=189966 RepID=A0A846MVQ4_9PROT|nr:amidohydrolase family protein [Rhizomicrobium palustre]NIK87299.1 imidazolonepropionase-like amidohydrolase [Rhizomicrobium palustre]